MELIGRRVIRDLRDLGPDGGDHVELHKVAALLSVSGFVVDSVRLTHLEPLVASLLADGERLTAYIGLETEPFFIAPPAGSKRPERDVDA